MLNRICRTALLLVLAVAMVLCLVTQAAGLDWSPEELVGDDDNDDDWAPQVAVTPDGNVWVVWMGFDPVDWDAEAYYSVYDGTGWSARALIHQENRDHDRYPLISVGEDGVPWVLWERHIGGWQYILLAAFWTGSGWSIPQVVREGAGSHDLEALLATGSQDVWVATDAYVDSLPDRTILTYHWDGAEWNGPWGVGATDAMNTGPDLAKGPDDTPWLVWSSHEDYPFGPDRVVCSRFEGGAWTSPEIVDDAPGYVSWTRIAFDHVGTPLVLWRGNGHEGPSTDIEYSRYVGGAWTPAEPLSEPDGYYDTDGAPACDVGPDGQVWVVWAYGHSSDPLTGDITASHWQGTGWGPEEAVSDTTGRKEDTYPDVCVGPDGSVWAVWMSYVDVWPYDYAILASHGTETTAVDFCCLEASVEDGVTHLSWYGGGEASSGSFPVWRLCPEDSEHPDLSQPPDGAEEVDVEETQGPPHWEATDSGVTPGRSYLYWVEWEGAASPTYLGPAQVFIPTDPSATPARILHTYPNPSPGRICVAYELSVPGEVELEIFDASGRCVARPSAGQQEPGRHVLPGDLLCWDGTSGSGDPVSSGVYFARLLLDGRKMEHQTAVVTIVK